MRRSFADHIDFCLEEIADFEGGISTQASDNPPAQISLFSYLRRFRFELALLRWRQGEIAASVSEFEKCLETYEIQKELAKSSSKALVEFERTYRDQIAFVYYAALFTGREVSKLVPGIDFIKRDATTLDGMDSLMSEALLFEDEVDWGAVIRDMRRAANDVYTKHYAFYADLLQKKKVVAADLEKHLTLFLERKTHSGFEEAHLMGGGEYNEYIPDYRLAAILMRYAPDAEGPHAWKRSGVNKLGLTHSL
ncbi:hypothetical protein [Maricaulis sp.]|uniref:hypothetical protein n=1 Tax=Maricaulis sp. TaxID=1486257 RepID=UPI001B039FE3|nr:hypothetical protein [Maricaulis sp.]MBO6797782.1 hypothetical protein [Maricaulis sp.]